MADERGGVGFTKVSTRSDTRDTECRRAVVAQRDGLSRAGCVWVLAAEYQAARRQSSIGSEITAHAFQGKYL